MENTNPCTDTLSDLEYLEHMIPHHQVAIDMSNLLIPNTNNPIMLHLCRDIIRKQGYEIWEMEMVRRNMIVPVYIQNNDDTTKYECDTILDYYYPLISKSKDGDCNPLFFEPNNHAKHMEHMEITDISYLEHMVPHHQVAVDMSKRLLMHTNNPYLIEFCRKLIIDQQYEIFYMNNLLNNTKMGNYNSNLIL